MPLLTLLALFLGPIHPPLQEASDPLLLNARPAPWRAGGPVWIENAGQWPAGVRFVGRSGGTVVRIEPRALGVQVTDATGCEGIYLRLVFEGSDPESQPVGEDLLPGIHNYFRGRDPSLWVSGARSFQRIRYPSLYPGLDAVVRWNGTRPEYDLVLQPGVDLSQVVVRCEGIDGLAIEAESGALLLETALGPLVQPVGRCWEVRDDGSERPLRFEYRILGKDRFGFEVPGRDLNLALLVDPEIVWSTYLGSAGRGIGDFATAVDVDSNGDVTVVGETSESSFPMTPGSFQGFYGTQIAFVTRLRGSDGQMIYSSLIGGDRSRPAGVDVDSAGRATVAGATFSTAFPTTPGAFDTVKNATNDSAFVFRLDPTGSQLEYSTFLEGVVRGSRAHAVEVLDSGQAIVGGRAFSADFPVTPGAFETTQLFACGFLTRLDPMGSSLEWSTFFGATSGSEVFDLAVGPSGEITATGTAGLNFPTTPGAFQGQVAFGTDTVVGRLDSTGSSLLWGTYVGGNAIDRAHEVTLTRTGDVIVGGTTLSTDFPVTQGAIQSSYGGGFREDGFVLRLDEAGSVLRFSTYLGGAGFAGVVGVGVDPSGIVTVSGTSVSSSFPTTPGAYRTVGVNDEMFVSRIHPQGTRLFYSSFVGGPSNDAGGFLGLHDASRVTLAGESWAPGSYPITEGAVQPSYAGGQRDAVVTTMDLILDGIQPRGSSNPSCLGPITLSATEMPVAGASTFGLYAGGAPPSTDGWLRVSVPQTSRLTDLPGLGRVVGRPSWVIPIESGPEGYTEVSMPLPSGSEGTRLCCRLFFVNTPSCPGAGNLSWSNALEIVVQ